MSNENAILYGEVTQPLFIQPGNALVEADFSRIERVAIVIGYKEGISGAVNPQYLADALEISKRFGGSIRLFNRDAESPLAFVLGASANWSVSAAS